MSCAAETLPMNLDPADLSTDEIVSAIRGGDVEAYRQIVLRYQGEVLRVVNAMVINPSSREDVVQQVFLRAWRSLDQYETGRGFGQWIKAIARNLAREELRKQFRYRGRVESYARLALERLEAEERAAPGEAEEIQATRERALRECLDRLDTAAGRVVRLHYLEGWKTEEIAAEIRRSGGAVRTLLYRTRAVLRDCLEAKLALP